MKYYIEIQGIGAPSLWRVPQPMALDFVTCSSIRNDIYFEIIYEEKTKTIIKVLFKDLEVTSENTKDMNLYIAKVDSMINNYFEKQLYLNKDKYYVAVHIPVETEKVENGFMANIFISCGLRKDDDGKFMY